MSLHDFLLRDPSCEGLAEGAIHAVSPLLDETDPGPTLELLDLWAFELAGKMPLPWDTGEALEALNDFLFRTHGLRGDRQHYDDPRNALLPQVLARKKGLPIALSILWIDLARRLGLDAVGIGLPGHFITALRTPGGLLCVDPFHGGRAVGDEEASELVHQATGGRVDFHPAMLRPASHRAILTRLVRNLHLRFVKIEAWDEALWTATHLLMLDPEDPLPYKERALVHLKRGALWQALEDFKVALAKARDEDPEVTRWVKKLESQ
jgi:regulator of sirC expression with transglutaminase-like and TPR domain